jgi:hypothetical protein
MWTAFDFYTCHLLKDFNMSQYVVWFDSSDVGSPVLNNAAGSLIAVLDACLVTGFNNKAVTSIVVASGIATATCNGHGFSNVASKDVLIAGATPAGLNGRKTLTFVDTNTFKFDATGISDQNATGTITAKRDSLGWVKEFSGTNKAIYKRTDINATTMRLRVDDTASAPTDARVRMIESATDIDTLTGLTPTEAQLAGGYYWTKGSNSTVAKNWRLVGDSRGFYFLAQDAGGWSRQIAYRFGDFKSFKNGDAYNCTLVGGAFSSSATNYVGVFTGFAAGDAQRCVARGFNQTGTAQIFTYAGFSGGISGGINSAIPGYPSPVDSGLLINPQVLVVENTGNSNYCARGIESGFCQLIAKMPFSDLQIVEPVVSLPNRKLLALSCMSTGSIDMQIAIDITGPWSY